MKNEIQKASKKGQEVLKKYNSFHGYTLEQLRYQRAMVTMQKELCKARVLTDIDSLKSSATGKSEGKGSKIALAGTVASTLFRGLNYLDYISLGLSAFGMGRKIFGLFGGKKKK
ncbi:MAG: hypothetical protein HDS79_08045 [Bacteroidales bacterium]|nr:hypothetical protein [Bacteroidales bacterium]